jgi:hypothetical protein
MITNRTPDEGALATVLQFVFLFGLTPVAQAQTAEPKPAAGENLFGGAATGGNELQQAVVTGYLIPRIGEGPQPVTADDQHI